MLYRRIGTIEANPWKPGADMTRVSVSQTDIDAGSPKPGDMIAINPLNGDDKWLISAAYFKDNYDKADPDE